MTTYTHETSLVQDSTCDGLPSLQHLENAFKYDPETGNLIWRKSQGTVRSGQIAGTVSFQGYICVGFKRKIYGVHRIVWKLVYGNVKRGFQIDHINGVRSDNRLTNLRLVPKIENARNQGQRKRRGSKSGVMGIYPCTPYADGSDRYIVQVQHKAYGTFRSLDEAKKRRDEVYRELGFHENHGLVREVI